MDLNSFLTLYQSDSNTQILAEYLKEGKQKIIARGLVGSLDAIVASTAIILNKKNNCPHIFLLHDKEEAFYFQNDLQNLLNKQKILLFPTSYKRPYKYEETENANVLQRAEVLNQINQGIAHRGFNNQVEEQLIIVTYPEAIVEKVINKQTLIENTFSAKVGEEVEISFLAEILTEYGFEKTEFVYEAGQFAIRGGIFDIFSFAHDLPYRLEFFGDEIESIRIFNPESQLSIDKVEHIAIIPNVENKFQHEERESFFKFIPETSQLWIKDVEGTLTVAEKSYDKVSESFEQIFQRTASEVLDSPEVLFLTKTKLYEQIKKFCCIEFGKKFHFDTKYKVDFFAQAQPSFNKDFTMISKHLEEGQDKLIQHIFISESFRQLERLQSIFDELNPNLDFETLNIVLREGFTDTSFKVACFTDHQIFERFHRYRSKESYSKSKAITLKELKTLQPGDFVTHIDYGIGRFAGMGKMKVSDSEQEAIRLVYKDNDLLFVSIHSLHKISRYSGKDNQVPKISKLGTGEWEVKKKKVKRKVQDIAEELISLYAKRKATEGYPFSKDGFMQAELESSFIYEDTPDQAKASVEVKEDMEKPHPMDRLVCGDVGFGKTEVAIRAAFKAVTDSKQVAVLVPTTILAMQHFRTFSERLKEFPCKVEYINRFRTTKQVKETLQRVKNGETDILIGTHRIASKDVSFKDLGLLIIDEEQKFGVKTKDKLKEFKVNVDVLTLTATPIPRTLHFSLMGARDLSIIATPPPNRQPVTTEIHTFNEEVIRDAISYELRRGGQVFFVHNRVSDIESVANIILKLVPDAKIGVAHGQMEGAKLEKKMMNFVDAEYDVLISTNIIEAGLDIPNANTIIINMAHTFGLSDLHQMRGRVGRSNKKAFCYLLAPPSIMLKPEIRKRLGALEEFSDLGDGFKVAMKDLDIRGAGNLLGAEQSGYITDLGFDTYHKILDDAVQELKENKFKELFQKEKKLEGLEVFKVDCNIETDLKVMIPETYVKNISERLELYLELDNLKDQKSLESFETALVDRFGKKPKEVEDLIEIVELRWLAERLGFEKLSLKNKLLKGYFISNNDNYFQSDIFAKILEFLQKNPSKAQLKETKSRAIILFDNISSIHSAKEILREMLNRSK